MLMESCRCSLIRRFSSTLHVLGISWTPSPASALRRRCRRRILTSVQRMSSLASLTLVISTFLFSLQFESWVLETSSYSSHKVIEILRSSKETVEESFWFLDIGKWIGSERNLNCIFVCCGLGIWPESQSFNDEGLGEIPSKWKGVCMEAPDFKKSNCNRS